MTVPPSAALLSLAWRVLKAQRGERVTYYVGDYSVALTAVLTRPSAGQVDMETDATIESRAWDWLIDPNELIDASSERIEPSLGSKIERADGTIYRVQPSDANGLCWRWSDGQRTWRRTRTEQE
jgi:hypothetical protein